MKVKLIRKILNLTEHEKIIVYGKTALDLYELMIRNKRNLNELQERYSHYLNNGTFQKERHRQRFYGRCIGQAKRKYKGAQRAYQYALNDFCKVVRENAIHIATTPTPQAISRIMRGF